jgi:hypothetical protein
MNIRKLKVEVFRQFFQFNFVFLVLHMSGYLFDGITVHYRTLSHFRRGMAERKSQTFPPQRFPTELDLTV